jgi:hypothetical protein
MEDAGLFVQLMWLHRVVGGDSGALVVPFMHVGTYPTRHLAHFCYFSGPDFILETNRGEFAVLQTSLYRYRGRTLS